MKKKALLYVMTAILLGTVTMVAPLTLLKPRYYGLVTSSCVENMSAFFEAVGRGEKCMGIGELWKEL